MIGLLKKLLHIKDCKHDWVRDYYCHNQEECGYIGKSTKEEIEYATKIGKEVWYMEPLN